MKYVVYTRLGDTLLFCEDNGIYLNKNISDPNVKKWDKKKDAEQSAKDNNDSSDLAGINYQVKEIN